MVQNYPRQSPKNLGQAQQQKRIGSLDINSIKQQRKKEQKNQFVSYTNKQLINTMNADQSMKFQEQVANKPRDSEFIKMGQGPSKSNPIN